jgi:hypothetical protein
VTYPESLRDDLPKGESHPINRTAIDAALAAAAVEHLDTIYFLRAGIEGWSTANSGDVLRIDFHAATSDRRRRVELRVHAVPGSLKRAVAEATVPSALARACAWLRQAEIAGNSWQSTDHVFVVRWADGVVRVSDW